MSNEPIDDDELESILAQLARSGGDAGTATLSRRVLADFDRVAARARTSRLTNLARLIWPNAPVWQPALALGASLVLGLLAGVAATDTGGGRNAQFALEDVPQFSNGDL